MVRKEDLQTYLVSEKLMSLATYDREIWISTLYYVSDDSLNLFFISNSLSRHVVSLKNESKVACAIYDSHQELDKSKTGLQIQGIANLVYEEDKIKWFFEEWEVKIGFRQGFHYQNYKRGKLDSFVYKVTPTLIKYLNKKLFGELGYGFYYGEKSIY